jgi:hypothetical protein
MVPDEVGSLRGVGPPQPWTNRHAAHSSPRAVFVDCTKLTIFVRWDNRISRKMKLSCGAREPSELYAPQARIMLQIFFLLALIGGCRNRDGANH